MGKRFPDSPGTHQTRESDVCGQAARLHAHDALSAHGPRAHEELGVSFRVRSWVTRTSGSAFAGQAQGQSLSLGCERRSCRTKPTGPPMRTLSGRGIVMT